MGYEGLYQVSDYSRIRSFYDIKEGSILNPVINSKSGYPQVTLHKNGKQKTYRVHKLVVNAFLPANPYKLTDINHLNGVKTDTHLNNFERCTRSHNIKHSYDVLHRKPPDLRGEKNGSAKLSNEDVREIFALKGKTIGKNLADKYGVTQSHICKIWGGMIWSSVTGQVYKRKQISSPDIVLDIYYLANFTDLPQKVIGDYFHVTFQVVSLIKNGGTYSQVTRHVIGQPPINHGMPASLKQKFPFLNLPEQVPQPVAVDRYTIDYWV